MGNRKIGIVIVILIICLVSGCGKNGSETDKVNVNIGNGTYFMFNNLLHYYDADSKKAVPLCFDATCDHSAEKADTCGAYKDTEFYFTSLEDEQQSRDILECADGNIWYKDGYIYMIEAKNYLDWDEATLVRYDKFGNNKEKIISLNSEYEMVGLWGDTDIGVKVIGDYMYYVKSVKAGKLGKEYICPEYTDSMANLFAGNYDDFVSHTQRRQCYVSLYKVPLDGHKQPEKLSDDIFFFGWGNDILEFISKGVIIGGNETDGITMVISDLGGTPNMDGSYFFEPKCQVYKYMPGDTQASKVCEFGFESDMFAGKVHWQRSSPYVDNSGRLLFATTEMVSTEQENYRMYAYSPKTNSCEVFYEKLGVKSIQDDGWINCTHVTRADDDYIYVYESTDEYFYINVFDKELKQVDTFNMTSTSAGSLRARQLGNIAYTDQYLIVAVSDAGTVIKTEDTEISMDAKVINLFEGTGKEGNKWAINDNYGYGYAYACVIDKSCIGTGKLKVTKLMEYPYAGYKY